MMLVYACNDLLFASKIQAATRAAGVVSRPARSAEMLTARLERFDDGKANGPVGAVWVDLEREDALALVALAAGHAAGPRVLAFGPHVEVDRLRAAAGAGAEVLTRGRFVGELEARVAGLAPGRADRRPPAD